MDEALTYLVHDKDLGSAEQRADDAKELPLTRAKVAALVDELIVQTVIELREELFEPHLVISDEETRRCQCVWTSAVGGLLYLVDGFPDVRVAELRRGIHVVAQRALEQDRVLRDDGEVAAQMIQICVDEQHG